ncbi:DUF368 domain-containing protein [Iamia sp. SCSIO 61187]|uniref:DUF368 domain-containing protein n=1 Tax=Iamia sp. SCSIO 61187 TaxID=2722752 RepID=UPI001C62768B|nr:DUF368 domain-containing protein [Iamia sp. SCSIO 61187]QYG91178.1 DUF368 domain-containing protein [Iamia sp. SCSIO 61187]
MQDLTSDPVAPERERPTAVGIVTLIAKGFAMGAADVVPGVSGGTVALVLGIYERLVGNIRHGAGALGHLLKLDVKGFIARLREVEWLFLIPLLSGIGLAVLSLAHVIEVALEDHPVPMGALFFGLVAASAVVAWRMIEHPDALRLVILVGVAIVTFFVLGASAGERSDASLLFFFAAGALAICAMILPGISGSFLLLAIGMYELVIGSVNDRDLAVIAVFAAGCVVGLSLFSSALSWALEYHRDPVLAALTGLMLGSLRVLWPWPIGTEETGLAAPGKQWGLALAIAVGAAVVVLVAAEIGRRIEGPFEEELEHLYD